MYILPMKTAIFCLTRGYPHIQYYTKLLERNKQIAKHFSAEDVDMILFNEGNIPFEHQKYIQVHSDLPLKFVTVPFNFPQSIEVPYETYKTFTDGSCYPGYHLMCEFNTCFVWDYLKGYDVGFRIDEDCIFISENWKERLQEFIQSNDVFRTPGYHKGQRDTHPLTNETLPPFLVSVFGTDTMYNNTPCSNLYMTKLAFWDKPEVREFLKKIETSQGCLKYRWGDHVLIGSALNLYAPDQFSIIKNIEYFHQSHNNIIKIGETEEKSWMS